MHTRTHTRKVTTSRPTKIGLPPFPGELLRLPRVNQALGAQASACRHGRGARATDWVLELNRARVRPCVVITGLPLERWWRHSAPSRRGNANCVPPRSRRRRGGWGARRAGLAHGPCVARGACSRCGAVWGRGARKRPCQGRRALLACACRLSRRSLPVCGRQLVRPGRNVPAAEGALRRGAEVLHPQVVGELVVARQPHDELPLAELLHADNALCVAGLDALAVRLVERDGWKLLQLMVCQPAANRHHLGLRERLFLLLLPYKHGARRNAACAPHHQRKHTEQNNNNDHHVLRVVAWWRRERRCEKVAQSAGGQQRMQDSRRMARKAGPGASGQRAGGWGGGGVGGRRHSWANAPVLAADETTGGPVDPEGSGPGERVVLSPAPPVADAPALAEGGTRTGQDRARGQAVRAEAGCLEGMGQGEGGGPCERARERRRSGRLGDQTFWLERLGSRARERGGAGALGRGGRMGMPLQTHAKAARKNRASGSELGRTPRGRSRCHCSPWLRWQSCPWFPRSKLRSHRPQRHPSSGPCSRPRVPHRCIFLRKRAMHTSTRRGE